MRATKLTVGVISDTHGLLRPAALAALAGCDHILHAGDVGKREVLEALASLAPVTAVRGNVDVKWAHDLPETAELSLAGQRIHLLHDLGQIQIDPAAAGFDVVVSGHSHVPKVERRGGVLYVNPGSAGPRRFKLPIALGLLEISARTVTARIVELADERKAPAPAPTGGERQRRRQRGTRP